MPGVNCPACGSAEVAARGVGGFRCKTCQRDVWIISCHRCHKACVIFGSATGAGAVEFRCQHCRAKNVVQKQVLRAISAEARRVERAEVATRREQAAQEKAARLRHVESSQDEAVRRNSELRADLDALQSLLGSSLVAASGFSFAALKLTPEKPPFEPGSLKEGEAPPDKAAFLPPPLKALTGLVPGAQRKQRERMQSAEAAFEEASAAHAERESERKAALGAARAAWGEKITAIDEATARQHADVDELERRFADGDSDAVTEYFAASLASMSMPFEQPAEPRVAFSAQSRQLVIEVELPGFDVIPDAREYRYVKARDEIKAVAMPATDRKRLYASLLAHIALATLRQTFSSDAHGVAETVVVNGHVDTVDKRTGNQIHPCLVTVRTTSDQFSGLNLAQVDPAECLKGLSA